MAERERLAMGHQRRSPEPSLESPGPLLNIFATLRGAENT
jgi:hypothetical protein